MTTPTVQVSVDVAQIVGTALPFAKVRLTLPRFDIVNSTGVVVAAGSATIACDENGHGVGPFFPNELGRQGTAYLVEVFDQNGLQVLPSAGRKVPAVIPASDCQLHACLFTLPPLTIGDAQYYSTEARSWAQYLGGDIPSTPGSRSAKSWAQEDLRGATYGGSSRDWSMGTGLIDGLFYSSRKYSLDSKASADASEVSRQVSDANKAGTAADRLQTGADRTATGVDVVTAGNSVTAATGAMLTAIAQASLASVMALAASSVAQQDLSGVTAAALHRSPNAVVSQAVYNAANDSDGGAWINKVDVSYLYETLNGAWLPSPSQGFASEFEARCSTSALGANLVLNGDGSTTAGWNQTVGGQGSIAATNGELVITTGNAGFSGYNQPIAGMAVGLYMVEMDVRCAAAGVTADIRFDFSVTKTVTSIVTQRVRFPVAISSTGSTNTWLKLSATAAGATVYFDNISVKPITGVFAPSGSYYQNAADGKFNRLWKNGVKSSADLSNAAWARVGNGYTFAGDGKIIPVAAAGVNTFFQQTVYGAGSAATGIKAVLTFKAKASEITHVWCGFGTNGNTLASGMVLDIATGAALGLTNVGGGLISLIGSAVDPADGYRRFAVLCDPQATAFVVNCQVSPSTLVGTEPAQPQLQRNNATFDGVGGCYVKDISWVLGSTDDGALEVKAAADGSQTEVFRGNTARFPRQAALIAEAGRLVIYDLVSPGRPMWMVFTSDASATLTSKVFYPDLKAVDARNGVVAVADGAAALRVINFARDTAETLYNAANQCQRFNGPLALRNSNLGFGIGSSYTGILANNVTTSIAMTTTLDAPVDPVTGLQVPTIAVGTAAGVTVIKGDSTIVNLLTANGGMISVSFGPRGDLLVTGGGGIVWKTWLFNSIPAANTNTADFVFDDSSIPRRAGTNASSGSTSNLIARNAGRVKYVPVPALGVLHALVHNPATPGAGLLGTIAPTYTTGFQAGDIRRCLLSDVSAGVVDGAEKAVNGDFATGDLTGWTTVSGTPSVVAQKLRLTGDGANRPVVSQTLALVPGATYALNVGTYDNAGGGTAVIRVGTTNNFANAIDLVNVNSPATGLVGTFTAPANGTAYLFAANLTVTAAQFSEFDNISVKAVINERSYKVKPASIFGSLTKTAVASAAQLMFWSGWSAVNYVREAYSADLDFGTGTVSLMSWVSFVGGSSGGNWLVQSSALDNAAWNKINGTTVTPNVSGVFDKVIPSATNAVQGVFQGTAGFVCPMFSCEVQAAGYTKVAIGESAQTGGWAAFDLTAGTVLSGGAGARIDNLGGGIFRIFVKPVLDQNSIATAVGNWGIRPLDAAYTNQNPNTYAFAGDGVSGILVRNCMVESKAGVLATITPSPYTDTLATAVRNISPIMERSFSGGARITLGIDYEGRLVGEVSDGTTTRTATSSITSYSNTGPVLVEMSLSTSGTLIVKANGEQVAISTGVPLLTLNNASAVLTLGNNFALTSAFPGGIAQARIGATVPSDDQSRLIYQLEKQMFRDAAQVTLPDSGLMVDLDYDPPLDRCHVTTAANEASFVGLVRVFTAAAAAGSNSKINARGGVKLIARTANNLGVDISAPSQNLKEELAKAGAEQAAARARGEEMFDYAGGFTATTTTGSAVLSAVAGLSLPTQGGVNLQGASVSGTGIPGGTTIAYHSGTTIHLSAPVTSGAAGTQINLLDFPLPTGMEARSVFAGAPGSATLKQEGATKDYARQFDGFREKPRFGTAPGNTAHVRVNARRMA